MKAKQSAVMWQVLSMFVEGALNIWDFKIHGMGFFKIQML